MGASQLCRESATKAPISAWGIRQRSPQRSRLGRGGQGGLAECTVLQTSPEHTRTTAARPAARAASSLRVTLISVRVADRPTKAVRPDCTAIGSDQGGAPHHGPGQGRAHALPQRHEHGREEEWHEQIEAKAARLGDERAGQEARQRRRDLHDPEDQTRSQVDPEIMAALPSGISRPAANWHPSAGTASELAAGPKRA